MKYLISNGLLLLILLPFSYKNKTEGANHIRTMTSWNIDASSSKVTFIIKNMGMEIKGTFGGIKGTFMFNEKNLENSGIEGSVEVNTINTGIAKRDEDLKANKYFDTGKSDQITFRSDSIIHNLKGYQVSGKMTIKGIAKHINMPFTFEQKGNEGLLKSQFILNRLDFGVGEKSAVMSDEVNVSLTIAVKKK